MGIISTFCLLPTSKITVTAEESRAECVMELHSRRVLYESHGDTRLPMASTTKIVTAATVLENCDDLQKAISIPDSAVGIEGSSVYLKEGEMYTIEELLYGLMLRSGNDCATALALYCAGSIFSFSALMNETVQKAGALNSHFQNPHGLPANEHYTTARDLTAISCYAMQNPFFRTIVSTRFYEAKGWHNKNKLLYSYDGAIGIKTGYTKEAGRCLVSSATRDGLTLVCTVLNCPSMYERSQKLLNDAFSAYEYRPIVRSNQVFSVGSRKGFSREEFSYPLLKEEEGAIEYRVTPLSYAGNEEIIGVLEITLAKRLLFSTNLYKL